MKETPFATIVKSPCCIKKFRLTVGSHSWCVDRGELKKLLASIEKVLR